MKKILTMLAAVVLFSSAASAQKGNIGFVYPAGAQRGSSFELTVGGQGLSSAKGIIFSGEGITAELIPQKAGVRTRGRKNKNIGEEDNLQLADQVKFRVTVDKNAKPGIRDVRLVLRNGLSNRLYFDVGELPDVLEDPKASISGVSDQLPVTFNGQVMNRDVDRFRFKAQAGQQLVLSVKARVLVPYMADAVPGWFQPIIRLYDKSGKEVAFNDDYTFHVDPVLFYKVPKSGEYEVEINDALYRGRGDFVYRISVGELPFITSISPLGAESGSRVKLALEGYNLKSKSLRVRAGKPGLQAVSVSGKGGISSNVMYLDVSESLPLQLVGSTPNSSMEQAWEIEEGEVCENCFSSPMQQHWYVMSVKKRGPVHIEVKSRCLGAPTDARLTVYTQDGSVVKDVDDFENIDDYMTTHYADPQITAPFKPGTYYIRVVESQGHSGNDYAYRLYVDKASPDFSLYIEPSTFTVPENGTGVFSVLLNKKQNFNGQVDLKLSGLPSGFKYKYVPLGQGQKKTMVSVTAPKGAKQEVVHPRVTGSASARNIEISREAKPVETMMQAFYYTHYMPIDEFRMEVTPEQPFRVIVDDAGRGPIRLDKDSAVDLKVRLDRNPGCVSPVTVMLRSSIPGVKAEAVVIPGNSNEATLHITLKGKKKNKKDIHGAISVYGVVKGSSNKIKGKARNAYVASVTAYAPVLEAVLPAAEQF